MQQRVKLLLFPEIYINAIYVRVSLNKTRNYVPFFMLIYNILLLHENNHQYLIVFEMLLLCEEEKVF